jgi:hypothetical protein
MPEQHEEGFSEPQGPPWRCPVCDYIDDMAP